MSLFYLYKFVWVFVHYLYDIFEYLCEFSRIVKSYFTENNTKPVLEDKYLERIKSFEKIPTHVTVLLGNEEPSYKDLANLILWCLCAGISYVSIYDRDGKTKYNARLLQKQVENRKNSDQQVVWKDKHLNGISYDSDKQSIQVKLFSLEDGRPAIVQAAKDVQDTAKSEDITLEYLDNILRKKYQFPDPNLGIYCGNEFRLYGYPPWQIRFTEFANVPTFHNLTQRTFFNILAFYSKVNQKLGA